MALPLKQIQEQEVPNYNEELGKLCAFQDDKAYYRKTNINWNKIKRANKNPKAIRKKAKLLSKDSQEVLAVIVQKLKRSKDGKVILNHKYISTITLCERKQNVRIINQLVNVINVEYHNSITHNKKKYRHSYEFSFKENLENIHAPKNSTGTTTPHHSPLQNAEVYSIEDPLKNNSSERTRSNGDLISLKNTDSETQNTNKENGDIEKESFQQDEVNERYNSNKNTGYVGKNGFLGKAKGLNEMKSYLTDLLCSELRSKSGREFSNKAISEIAQNIANKGSEVFFMHINGFIRYMTDVLKNEKRDAVQTSNDNFYIKANKKPEELIEHREQAEMHKYLNQVEQDSITNRSDETQFKARIANSFSPRTAYILLKNLSFIRKTEEVLELHLTSRCSLTPSEETRILWQAQSIGGYGDTQELKFVI